MHDCRFKAGLTGIRAVMTKVFKKENILLVCSLNAIFKRETTVINMYEILYKLWYVMIEQPEFISSKSSATNGNSRDPLRTLDMS